MLIIMVLIWTSIKYPINISSILGIWTINCLIPPMDAELMDGHIRTRDVYDLLYLMDFHKENLTLTHYMLGAWWLYFLDGLVHYCIHTGSIKQVLVTTNNIMTLGYTYYKYRLKKPPDIFCKISHTGRFIV